MAVILSDDILGRLLCSICKKYLSCGPTKIHRKGKISCGRCDADETTSPNSLYENVALYSLFPCVNRYEGCNKLLQYQDVAQHEKSCKGTTTPCPICPSVPSNCYSLLSLIDHYRTVHDEYFLKEPKFYIDVNRMYDSSYLYCDDSSNSLFFIHAACTQDRLFINASIPDNRKVVQMFRLNNVLQEPDRVKLCPLLEESEHEHFEIKLTLGEETKPILCEFVYDILERALPVVEAVHFHNTVSEPPSRDQVQRRMPKLYLDNSIFSEKHKYRLSSCKRKLIRDNDKYSDITLKCGCCDTYYWNVPDWWKINLTSSHDSLDYGLLSFIYKNSNNLICLTCYKYLYKCNEKIFKPKRTSIFDIRFYCRYGCGMICCMWDLYKHEKDCEFNLEKDSEEFVKKCFGVDSYEEGDLFVNGNVVLPFRFEVASYSFAIFGLNPRTKKKEDVTTPEKVIYLVTDDGFKCKIYYKYDKGYICLRVEHNYDKSSHLVRILIESKGDTPVKEIMYSEKSEYLSRYEWSLAVERKSDGFVQYVHYPPCFVVIIKKLVSSSHVIL